MIGVICKDAGGAEIISSYIRNNKINAIFCLENPAINIFKRKKIKFVNNSLKNVIEKSDWILTGTSPIRKKEIKGIIESKKINKKCVSFIDSWVNYKERFLYNGKLFLPDEIWTGDIYALKLAKKTFKNNKIILKYNPYFSEIKNTIKIYKKKNYYSLKKNILFIAAPISNYFHNNKNVKILNFFLFKIKKINFNYEKIIFRPHPSQNNLNKLSIFLKKLNSRIILSNNSNLFIDIKKCNYVFGSNSTALVVASFFNKKVYNIVPKQFNLRNYLPYKKINNFENLL